MTVLFVVATIVVFLGIDWVVQRSRARKGLAPARPVEQGPFPQPRVPEGIFFARSHTWLSLFPSGKVRIGIDDFVANLLDKARLTLVRSTGDQVEKGDPLVVLSEGGHALTVRAPIAGKILTVNEKLEESPGLLSTDLFSNGWAYTIRPANPNELRGLLLGNESRSWMSGELARLRDFFAGAVANGALAPAALQDGGVPVRGSLLHLDPEVWKRFEQEFLQAD